MSERRPTKQTSFSNASPFEFGMGLAEDSSKILYRALMVSLAIHLGVVAIFMTMKVPLLLQRVHQTRIIDYREIKSVLQEARKEIVPMPEVAKTTGGSGKTSSKITKPRKVKTGGGLLSLNLANHPTVILELPMPVTSQNKVSKTKTIDIQKANPTDQGPIRLLSLEHIAPKTYKGGLNESLRVNNKTQIAIEPKEVEVRGGLEDLVVRRIIEERLPAIRICYETALLQSPEIQGEIVVSWTIQPDGRVSDVLSESKEISQEELQTCLRDRVSQWKFPEPKGGGIVNIRYPFVFKRVDG